MAIRISTKSASPASLAIIGGLTLILIFVFFYLLVFRTGILVSRQPAPPPATFTGIEQRLSTLRQQTGSETTAIGEHELYQKSLIFGELPLRPPSPGRDNPFLPY